MTEEGRGLAVKAAGGLAGEGEIPGQARDDVVG
jgi:hypothetical protein